MRAVTLIAGPTASGKSACALRMAEATGASIVNADSMQVYDVLRVLTARPDDADLVRAPHHLFGHVSPTTHYSTGQWARDVETLLAQVDPQAPLIFVGGTGLYFRALTDGLSPMPEIEAGMRAHFRQALAERGAPAMHAMLMERDPEAAESLDPADGQRIVRALEVLEASGRSIRWWRNQPRTPLLDSSVAPRRLLIVPDRPALHARIDARFDAMLAAGALDEVTRLQALGPGPDMPAMKAIGVRELAAVLDGTAEKSDAVERAKAASRQYAKRQMTWWRHQSDARWEVFADAALV